MLTWAMSTSVRRLRHRYQHSELFFFCLPTDTYRDRGCADDLTPVDFAAAAAVYMAVRKPADSIGKRFHLQNPAPPLPLKSITQSLRTAGHALDSVTRAEFVTSKFSCDLLRRFHIPCRRSTRAAAHMLSSLHCVLLAGLQNAADLERRNADTTSRAMQELEAGFEAFETYFKSSGKPFLTIDAA